ncbi:insulinase family protein [Deinococcus psychrotolerans]|uniref:Insulinase family protein n=1 Tax=Deinococcus psychrotolerans TaxID=2489213 RepID=A0A3G8YPN5_9DEIO|nr:pitrilysin family protein [Deinococcus psychrotolerans]AZI43136.1 insulinase family protein [Deinococcus psychrotolerans]
MSETTLLKPTKHVLSSGLTVLLERDPDAQTLAMGYFVGTGARDERPAELGASHFLEHLMFKGSESVSALDLNTRLDALGGQANAFTSEEATVYHAASLPEQAGELLSALSVLLTPALRPEEVSTERGVILEEIEMYADQPDSRLMDILNAEYWGEHPLGHLVLGTAQTVSALTPEVLRRNFAERYAAPNITLAVCGQFDEQAVLDAAEQACAEWPRHSFERQITPHVPQSGLSVTPDPELSRAQVALAAPGLSNADPLREAAHVLTEIIGGENGRLYWALVDTGLCDSADLSHAEYDGAGMFVGGFSCDPPRTQEVLDAYRAVLGEVQNGGITDLEVRRAARKIAVGALLRSGTPQGRLFSLGMDYLARGELISASESVRRYADVTPEQVRAVLERRPFDVLRVAVLGPVGELV